uniref:MRG domain-containing protein n=1 Tax=Monodelphis domestica TaxID=13616 RepID=A0A5F8HH20_MONDO
SPGSGAGGGGGSGPNELTPGPPEEVVVWSPEVEVCLFHAMLGHKPVGVNWHFHMICIRDKFSQNIGRQISSKVIWDHLSTMYDIQALHESEILPFPNSEKNFILPEEIIQEHINLLINAYQMPNKLGPGFFLSLGLIPNTGRDRLLYIKNH